MDRSLVKEKKKNRTGIWICGYTHSHTGDKTGYTNWAFTRGGNADFIDCLDYIFLSEGVEVLLVLFFLKFFFTDGLDYVFYPGGLKVFFCCVCVP